MEHHKKIKEGIFLFKGKVQEHTDERRSIKDIALPHLPGFSIRQVKRMDFEKKGIVVGNHFHTRESGRIEVYIAMGTPKKKLFEFLYRKKGGRIRKVSFFSGDGVLIPPLYTHAFKVFYEDSSLWGLSNLPEYKTEEDVKDIIAE